MRILLTREKRLRRGKEEGEVGEGGRREGGKGGGKRGKEE